MIEQVTGTGSSGIAEKSASTGKQAASGLFAKLMAMFGKQGKANEGNASLADNQQPKFTVIQHITLGQPKSVQKELLTGPVKATKLATPQVNKSEDGSTVQAVALQILSQQHATAPKSATLKFNSDETTGGKKQTIRFGTSSDKQPTTMSGDGKQNKTAPAASTKDTSVQAANGNKQVNTQTTDTKEARVQTTDGKQITTQVADAKAAPLQAADGKQITTQVADAKAAPLQAADGKQITTPVADAKAAPLQAADGKQITTPVADAKAAPLQAADGKQITTQATDTKEARVQTTDGKQFTTQVADAKAAPLQAADGKQITTPVADAKAAPLQAADGKQITAPVADTKAASLQTAGKKTASVQTAGGKPFSTPVAQAKEISVQAAAKGSDAEQPIFNSQTKPAAAATGLTADKQSQPAKQTPAAQVDNSTADKVVTARSSATISTTSTVQNSVVTGPQASEQVSESTVFTSAIPSNKGDKQAAALAKNEKVKHASEAKQNAGTERVSPVVLHNVTTQQPLQQQAAGTLTAESLAQGLAQGDGGQQSGDKSNQETHSFQIISADNRPASASVSASHFQQYLNHRPTPTMSMFDSIQHISQSAKNGMNRLEIQLDPIHLGKIQISLQTDANNQLQVHIMADQSGTRTAIDQQLPALKHALAQQGLNLSGFSMGSHGEQAASGFGNRQSSGGSQPDKNSTDNVTTSPIAANRQSASHSDSGLSIHI